MNNLDKENRLKELHKLLEEPVKRHFWSAFDFQNLRESYEIGDNLFSEKNPNYGFRDFKNFMAELSNEPKD